MTQPIWDSFHTHPQAFPKHFAEGRGYVQLRPSKALQSTKEAGRSDFKTIAMVTVTREHAGKGHLICTASGEKLLEKRLLGAKGREVETGMSLGMRLKSMFRVL